MNWSELKQDFESHFTDRVMTGVKREQRVNRLSINVMRWSVAACLAVLLVSGLSVAEWSLDGWLGLAEYTEEILVNVELNGN